MYAIAAASICFNIKSLGGVAYLLVKCAGSLNTVVITSKHAGNVRYLTLQEVHG